MYDLAKKARAGMKSKAERLAGEKDRKTDSSDWSPAEPLNADVKTGMRPVSRRAYKDGGKVAGSAPKGRADRKPRKAGGKVEEKGEQPMVDRYVNRDLKKANEYRDGKKHIGGLKTGGRAHKADGGPADLPIKKGSTPKDFWTYQSGSETPSSPPAGSKMSKSEWESLSPGMRREIHRSFLKLPTKANGGRAGKANGGSMTMEEMIRKNPAPVKKPLGLDKVPLPPRRPADVTPAANNKIKPDQTKYLTGDDITGPPKEIRKDGGRMKRADGGSTKKSAWDMSAAEMLESSRKRQEDVKKGVEESKKKYPGMSAIERAEQSIKDKFTPAYFANLKKEKEKEKDSDEGYKEFADRRAKRDSDADEKRNGGRAKKADGGPMMMDPRLGIVKPKAMEFGQNVVTPGLKKGGRIAKQIGGALGMSANSMMPQLPPQAMANAQGAPMQGGAFMPPGMANRPSMPPAMPNANPAAMPSAASSPMMMSPSSMPLARAEGGRTKSKGKTNINIVIATGKQQQPQSMVPDVNAAPMGPQGIPVPTPAPTAPMGVPPVPAAPMMGGPAPSGPMTPPSPMMPPMPRKAGGRVSKVAKSFKDMTAGAGSGEGRLQKTDIAKRAPHKAGGKVYRSYKDMDAGAGSGKGRLEKTEIQTRKK